MYIWDNSDFVKCAFFMFYGRKGNGIMNTFYMKVNFPTFLIFKNLYNDPMTL